MSLGPAIDPLRSASLPDLDLLQETPLPQKQKHRQDSACHRTMGQGSEKGGANLGQGLDDDHTIRKGDLRLVAEGGCDEDEIVNRIGNGGKEEVRASNAEASSAWNDMEAKDTPWSYIWCILLCVASDAIALSAPLPYLPQFCATQVGR